MGTTALSSLPSVESAGFDYDVFINYNRVDLESVSVIVDRLTRAGLRVWFDLWSVPKGANWQNEMSRGIRRSLCLAACIGPGAVGYWQTNEYQMAIIVQRQRDSLIIPVLLPDAPPEKIPDFLTLNNAVNFSKGLDNNSEFDQFVDAIHRFKRGAVASQPPSAKAQAADLAAQPDLAEPVEDLLASLASDNITFFVGSETTAASSPPLTRECDIAFQLLPGMAAGQPQSITCAKCGAIFAPALRCPACGTVNPAAALSSMLLPAETAALYYAVQKRGDSGLEDTVAALVKSRSRIDGGAQSELARLLPRLMNFSRPSGRKPHRQLIVSASLDTLMERALVQNRIRFVRIVARRDDPAHRERRLFDVNDYSKVEFGADGAAFDPLANRKYPLSRREEIDSFIQDCGHRLITGDQAPELLKSDDLLIPVLFKIRGSYDLRDSSAISSVHFIEVARTLALETRLMEPLSETAQHTPIVFMGMNFLGPEFRLSVQALLGNDLTSDSRRYLFQRIPDADTDNCFGRLEAGIWRQLKDHALRRNVSIVERQPEEALEALGSAVKARNS